MKELPSILHLTEAFRNFPSVGEKSAERMAYALLEMDKEQISYLLRSIENASTKVHLCPKCGLLTEEDICSICSSSERNHRLMIVLSHPKDVIPFEKMRNYKGIYHVLGGDISSIQDINPEDLTIKELNARLESEGVEELILATSPTIEGETTALYLSRLFINKNIKITRLAYGLPIGASFEYTDELTLSRALQGRTNMKGDK